MSLERPGAVTFKGNPLTLVGPKLSVGDKVPNFKVVTRDLSPFTLSDTEGSAKIFNVVPSLDTPVCDTQTRRFNKEASNLPGLKIYTVSMDLPFAQSRWCAAAGVDKLVMLSDYQTAEFGTAFGTLIKELRLDTRAIFVVDKAGTVQYVEYVEEMTNHPDYDSALDAAKKVAG